MRGAFLFLCVSMTFLTLRNDGVLAGIHTLPTEKGIAYWQGIALDELKVQIRQESLRKQKEEADTAIVRRFYSRTIPATDFGVGQKILLARERIASQSRYTRLVLLGLVTRLRPSAPRNRVPCLTCIIFILNYFHPAS